MEIAMRKRSGFLVLFFLCEPGHVESVEQAKVRQFVVADLDARGELHSRQIYQYDDLVQLPRATDLIGAFSAAIWKTPEGFDIDPITGDCHVSLRWRAHAPTAGMLTLRCQGELASLSLLVSGLDLDADRITLETFQRHLLQELHDTGYEPAFDVVSLSDRPLVATINVRSPAELADQLVIALADRCFAASYFRFQNLA
jgi:hypothetical protein